MPYPPEKFTRNLVAPRKKHSHQFPRAAASLSSAAAYVLSFLVIFLCAQPAISATIFRASHFYAFNGDPRAVEIDVQVFDNFNGDHTKYLWQYTVKNNSFDPDPGVGNGFSGFELALPVSPLQSAPDFGNVSAPSSSWVINCCSGEPVEWDDPSGQGILPGQQGVFSFTSMPRTPTASNGWFHTWEYGLQTYVTFYTAADGPEAPSVTLSTLVDPVPDLLPALSAGLQGTEDLADLTGKGRVVSGVSADGVTQVVVKVGASIRGEHLRLTVLNGPSADEYGSLRPITSASTGASVDVTAASTSLGPMAFAVYQAPKDFVRPGTNDDALASRTVDIQVQSLDTGRSYVLPVVIVRPPLLLIHGLWGSINAWNFFGVTTNGQLRLLSHDPRFETFLVNYSKTHADGFALNAHIVGEIIKQDLNSFTTGTNRQQIKVAAVQADIVAHSMGGDIARTIVTRLGYLSDRNYHHGVIHKLITIDTPHLGSEFANRLYSSQSLCKAVLNHFHMRVGNAIRDLQTTSTMITTTLQQKIYPIEASTIEGVATQAQADTAEKNFNNLGWWIFSAKTVCPNLLPAGGFAQIFGQDTSDLIVSGKSQQAVGLGYNGGSPPTIVANGLIHSVDPVIFTYGPDALSRDIENGKWAPVDTENPQSVIDLLNSPVGSGEFQELLP